MAKTMNEIDQNTFDGVKNMLEDKWPKTLEIHYCEGYDNHNERTIITDIKYHNINHVSICGVLSDSLLINIIDYLFENKKIYLEVDNDKYGINNIELFDEGMRILRIYYLDSSNFSLLTNYDRLVRIMNNYLQVIKAYLPMKKSEKEQTIEKLTDGEITRIFDNLSLEEKRNLLYGISIDRLHALNGKVTLNEQSKKLIKNRYKSKNNRS